MTSEKIIEEIKLLPPDEQTAVIRFALRLAGERQLTGTELNQLARRMVESDDPAEVIRLKSAISDGFYGEPAHA